MEKDVTTDPEARAEMMRRKVTGVPAFLIGDEILVGLDQEKILSLVDHRVVSCSQCGTKVRIPVNKGKLRITCRKCGTIFEAEAK